MKKAILIFKKELLETLRDKRTFIACVISPLFVYPALFGIMGYFINKERLQDSKAIYAISVMDMTRMSELGRIIEESKKFRIVEAVEPLAMLERKRTRLVVEPVAENQITLHYNGADMQSLAALKHMRELISEYEKFLIEKEIASLGLSGDILRTVEVEEKNIASPREMGGFVLASLIPLILVITGFGASMHTAFDLTAGEKERRTIETLLVSDTTRGEIVFGKSLAAMVVALMASISTLLGLIVTLESGFSFLSMVGESPISTPWSGCISMLIVMIPLLFFFAVLLMAIGSFARRMREASAYGSYLTMVVVMLGVFSVFRSSVESRLLFVIPVVNIMTLQRQILTGMVAYQNLIITIFSTILYGSVSYLIAKNNFERDEILFRC